MEKYRFYMTFTGSIRKAGLSLLLLALLPCCKKAEPVKRDVSEVFITSSGAVEEHYLGDYRVVIPAGALAEDQYMVIDVNSDFDQMIHTTDSKVIVTNLLSMVSYNGDQLLLPGTIEYKYLITELGSPIDNWEFSDTDIRAYCTDNKNDFNDYHKWIEVPIQVRNDTMISIQFTDITKTYFLAWSE